MTHSDDDGLVLPPRLAPQHVVILPIYRDDEQRATVLEYCQSLQQELQAVDYGDGKVRVAIDDRDIRGGEKNWYHVKRGVPLAGRDRSRRTSRRTASSSGRRDSGQKQSVDRQQFVADHRPTRWTRSSRRCSSGRWRLRLEHTRKIDSLDEFRAFFTPQNADQPEIHGGFALCHWAEDPAVEPLLNELKVTIRCIPFERDEEPGTCLFTGRPSRQRVVFAKAY